MLSTSGFMDDVAFGVVGRPTIPLAALRHWVGVWCLWMPCYYCCCCWFRFWSSAGLK